MIKILLIYLILFLSVNVYSQKKDTINKNTLITKNEIIPISLITAGSILNFGNRKYDFQSYIKKTNTNVDDYIQYAPTGIMYISDAIGIKHKNTAFNQTKYLFLSELSAGLIVLFLKNISNIESPNKENYSFPSGHTTQSFVGATTLYNEFKDYNKLIAYSGYFFSSATGILRITNNKHWISDVLCGAGIGIIITNVIYKLEPLKNWNPFKQKQNLSFYPNYNYFNQNISLTVKIIL
ncbi:MAG: phosphatase PAP2 family protein [Bacteroidetes bacterium]|nr:phosphatase PAP2 family protein [Bacteroidota bacterium]